MTRPGNLWMVTTIALAAGLAAGCATVTRYDASQDIREFLVAVRDGDRAAFDAHIDRPALKANMRARLLAAAAGRYGAQSRETVGALAAGPLVDVAVDALVRPQVFKAAAELAGYGPQTRIPPSIGITRDVTSLGSDRVCAMVKGKCAFIFKHEEGGWRMIDFEGDLGLLKR